MEINLIDNPEFRKPKYWSFKSGDKYLSHHMYKNSPFETCDSCGNCDGARCDGCKMIYLDDYLEFTFECSEETENIFKENFNLPDDQIYDYMYDDFYKNCNYKNYIITPSNFNFKNNYPDEYENVFEQLKNKSDKKYS